MTLALRPAQDGARAGSTLYVSDLDGTLTGPDGTISDFTRDTVAGLVAGGTGVTVATARSGASARRALAGLRLELPMVVYSGASAVDADGTPMWWEHFDGRIVRPLIGAGLAAGITPVVFWLDGDAERLSWVRGAETPELEMFLAERAGDPRIAAVDGWDEIDSERAFFVSLNGQAGPLRRLARMVRAISWGRGCALALQPGEDGTAMLDVTADIATKGLAVRRIADELGYDRIVAYGDGANDLDLFAEANESYAVADADEEVRASATAVIGPSAADSVARHLAAQAARARV